MLDMSSNDNIHIGIIGSGRMGTDIARYLSEYEVRITWVCQGEGERVRCAGDYDKKLGRLHRNGLIDDAQLRERKSGIVITDDQGALSGCDIVIEAIHENAADKARLFMGVTPFLQDSAVLATNTSSIKPSLLISDDAVKQRFAGLHFFYPVKLKNLVELITTEYTSEKTIAVLRDFLSLIDKFHLEMPEEEGFVMNRLFLDFQAQAFRFHHDDGIPMSTLDEIIIQNIFPVGVFEFFDTVGIDTMQQSVINYTEDLAGRDFYKPMIDSLELLLSRGRLGRKSGAGFYEYPAGRKKAPVLGEDTKKHVITLLRCLYINAAFRALEKNIWSRDDLEFAVREYMGIDRGPFATAEEIGKAEIKSVLSRYFSITGFEAYRPSALLC